MLVKVRGGRVYLSTCVYCHEYVSTTNDEDKRAWVLTSRWAFARGMSLSISHSKLRSSCLSPSNPAKCHTISLRSHS